MKDLVVKHFSRFSPLTEEEANVIRESMIIEHFSKGTYLLKEGQAQVDTYFVLKGCVREFIDKDGEERTTNFFTEDQWVISLGNFNSQSSTENNLVCAEDTSVMVGNEKSAQEIFKKYPRFETISRMVMEAYFSEQKALLTSYFTDSPEDRYLTLLKYRPDLFQRIPQYQLASYIGVKPESLSRIRKRILKGN